MARLRRFIETYRGSSFPTRSETTDGQICVVKLRGAGNGAAGLLSEFIVNRLAHAAGMPVPDASTIEIPANFPWEFGTDEFHDLVKKSPGPSLGLAWLEGTRPVPASRYNALSHDFVSQVVTLDRVFANRDRSVQSGNLLEDRAHRLWIVDHGSCRFLFQPAADRLPLLPPDHIYAGRDEAFEPRWVRDIAPQQIAQTLDEIPDAWLAETALTRPTIAQALEACLRFVR